MKYFYENTPSLSVGKTGHFSYKYTNVLHAKIHPSGMQE